MRERSGAPASGLAARFETIASHIEARGSDEALGPLLASAAQSCARAAAQERAAVVREARLWAKRFTGDGRRSM